MQRDEIEGLIAESSQTLAGLASSAEAIRVAGESLVRVLKSGGKVLTAGNGGSAAEALHMSEEIIGRYKGNRRSLPAVSLTADTTAITCIGNDFGFSEIFSRQVEGLGRRGDALVLFSTSGSAENLQRALKVATEAGLTTVCLLGRDGGKLAGLSDHEIIVKGSKTERIQEAHQLILHVLLEIIEQEFA